MTETPCKGFLSIASSIEELAEQIASLSIDNSNEYHVILTLFDYREKQVIPSRLANFFEICWIGELLDLEGDELSLVDRTFDELYEKHYNVPNKSLALLTPPPNCGWENLKITIRTEFDSITHYDDAILACDRIEFAFLNAQNQVIDNTKVEVKAWDVSVFWKKQKSFKTANNAWLLLREFAFNNGTIHDSRICNTKNALSTAKGELAKLLAQLCNLPAQGKSGPFPRATSKGSKCNFSISMINIASVITNERNSRPYDSQKE